MHITYADLIAADQLRPDEAIALGLAAAAVVGDGHSLPATTDLLLSSTGVVVRRDGAAPLEAHDPAAWLAGLLHRLLRLDADDPGNRRMVPGGLLILLARVSGQLDAGRPSFAAFVEGLRRFGSADPAVLQGVFVRMAPAPQLAAAPLLRGRARRTGWRAVPVALGSAAAGVALGYALFLPVFSRPDSPGMAPRPAASPVAAGRPPAPAIPFERVETPPAEARARDAFSPAFAASGRELLFHTGRQPAVLMRASLDARGRIQRVTALQQQSAANYHVTSSPDGKWIAFDSDRDGARGVYVARANGDAPRRISGDGVAAVPTWSPDGRRIAFVRAEPDRPRVWNIWLADLATGRFVRVTGHRRGQPWSASWFPDGERIAYSHETSVMIADLRSGTAQRIDSPRPGRLIRTPSVSPDGRHVVYQVYRDGAWLLDVETRTQRRILAEPTAEEFAWSPDGRRIAFHARRAGRWSLWQSEVDPDRASASAPTALFGGRS